MSKRVKVLVPVPLDEKAVSPHCAPLPDHFVRPGFEIELVPVQSYGDLDTSYDVLLMDMAILEAGARAEQEGYDALCLDTMSDAGLYVLRSRVKIPVLGLGQTAFHIAGTLGHKFSVITLWNQWLPLYQKNLTEYRLWEKVASLRAVKTQPDMDVFPNEKTDELLAQLEQEARHAITEDGADVIVLGSTTMHIAYEYLKERLPVPVIHPGLVMYKMCEVFLELGLSHSKQAFPFPQLTDDDTKRSHLTVVK